MLNLDDDAGYFEVTAGGETHRLDLYHAYNDLSRIYRETPGDDVAAKHAAQADYLVGLGLPRLAHYAVCKLWDALGVRITELGKADGGEPTAA